ncbi:MAG: T9SS type A sorting domain-containing protein [Bacteroidota bacterium]|nr:T9SS type A sorting domain-containing protein [Bacteroidota bacterium]
MKTTLLISTCLVLSILVTAQPLSLDQSFDPNFNFFGGIGSNGLLSSIVKLDNGDIIVAGYFDFIKNNKTYGDMVRLSQNGILDETFNNIVGLISIGKMIDRQDSLFAIRSMSCHFYDFNGNILFNSWYSNFNNDLENRIGDIKFFDDNSALVGGGGMVYLPDTTYLTRYNLVFVKPDGHVDTTFDHEPDHFVRDIVMYDYDRVLLSGRFNEYDNTSIKTLCRIYNNGELDTSFHSIFIEGMAIPFWVQGDGKIIVGGGFWLEGDTIIDSGINYNNRCLVRLLPDGSLDTTFNNSPVDGFPGYSTNIMCPTYDGGFLVGGYFTHYDGFPRKNIAKIDANGFLDTTVFNGSAFDTVVTTSDESWIRILTQGPNETYYVGGNFDRYNGQVVQPIVRLHNEYYGLEEQEKKHDGIEIFPNPAKDKLIINTQKTINEIEIFHLSGVLVHKETANNKNIILDVSALPPGNYLLRATGKDEVWVKKFVVLR